MSQSAALPDFRALHGTNVRRLMARRGMSLQELVEASGLDERTVRSILQECTRPHMRTLHKLADGLGVSTDELFQDPFPSDRQSFDMATNPAVAEVIEQHPELFTDWTEADFAELYSRVAVGGELTEAGAMAAAEAMNERRELMYQVAVLLESSEGDLLREFIQMLYRRVTVEE